MATTSNNAIERRIELSLGFPAFHLTDVNFVGVRQ